MNIAMIPPSILAFGSQTTWPSSTYLSYLRNRLILEPRLRSFLAAIKELPVLWRELTDHDPDLAAVSGQASLDDLVEWLNRGKFKSTKGTPPNVLTTPFTVILHVTQYFHYLGLLQSHHPEVLKNLKAGGVQGFCTGMLSAIAVACSENEEDVNRLGAVALRLALCIGAYVDLDAVSASAKNETASIAVRWRSGDGHDIVLETLKHYPDVSSVVLLRRIRI